jgi:hypothetical protein
MREGQGLKEDGVDDAEDGRVGADAERQGENGDAAPVHGKAAAAVQLPQCVTNIVRRTTE